jgi:hypothetical protein
LSLAAWSRVAGAAKPGMKVRYVVEDRGGARYVTKIVTED